jgi:lysozyme
MTIQETTLQLIRQFEGCKLTAYQDVKGVWTIGYGNTFYENDNKVQQGDKISQARAEELLYNIALPFAEKVNKLITITVTQNQYDSCVSLAYNIGLNNFMNSTLLKKININPNDVTISNSFLVWDMSGGKHIPGLLRRRTAEAKNYYNKN